MSDTPEPIAPVEDAPAFSEEQLSAAFDNATPVAQAPAPEPFAPEPVVALTPAVEAPAPVAPVAAAVEPDAVVPPQVAAPDYAAYLKEQFGVEAPEALKEKLTQAETAAANQRTAQDVAFAQLLADPAKAVEFVKLQSTDFKALSPQELHAAEYAHKHPELSARLAASEAAIKFEKKYGAAAFDDPDDPAVEAAKLRLDHDTQARVAKMEGLKTTTRDALVGAAKPVEAEGPTPEQVAAQKEHNDKWMAGVDSITTSAGVDVVYNVAGKDYTVSLDNQTPEFKEAVLDPMQWLANTVQPNGKPDFDTLALVISSYMNREKTFTTGFEAGKASLGAVIPMTNAVNPNPGAPQAPVGGMTLEEAFAQAAPRGGGRNNQY